jgi:hypothetical protein
MRAETEARLGVLGGAATVECGGSLRPGRTGKNEMAPVGAGGGRNAPTGADRQGRSRSFEVRASPEMRPGSHDWAATPQASPSHM